MGKSTAPSGLSISKNWGTFGCSWKIPTRKYGDGQKFQYKTNGDWITVDIGKTTKSKSIWIDKTKLYPTGGYCTMFSFRFRGNTAK